MLKTHILSWLPTLSLAMLEGTDKLIKLKGIDVALLCLGASVAFLTWTKPGILWLKKLGALVYALYSLVMTTQSSTVLLYWHCLDRAFWLGVLMILCIPGITPYSWEFCVLPHKTKWSCLFSYDMIILTAESHGHITCLRPHPPFSSQTTWPPRYIYSHSSCILYIFCIYSVKN